jgi:hypothetical protein
VIAAKPLTHPSLCRYLDDRKIPLDVAEKYCHEVEFELNGKQYFAIGFENKSGGFELRNEHFKQQAHEKEDKYGKPGIPCGCKRCTKK